MANDYAKKVLKKNSRILRNVRIALLGSLAIYLLLMYIYRDRATPVSIGISVVHYGLAVVIYRIFRHLSQGTYDSTGRLVSSGLELSGTVVNIAFDILYIVLLVFTISPVTPKIYWADLFIVVSIFYGFWSIVIKPMMQLTDMKEAAAQSKDSRPTSRDKKRYKY